MKFIIALILAVVSFLSVAQVTPSVALTVGQWITRNTKSVYYVRVTANGENFNDAKQNGFRKAIELAVGSVVLVETEVSNNKLIRNDIISYSSGYVDDYTVVSQTGNSVTMDVWVSNSKIANRLEAMGVSSSNTVNGQAIERDWERRAAQDITANQRQRDAHSMLSAVLADYPRMALVAKPIGTRVLKSHNGDPVLVASYEISVDQRYAESLEAVLIESRAGRALSDARLNDFELQRSWFDTTAGYWPEAKSKILWLDTFEKTDVHLRIDMGNRWYCWSIRDTLYKEGVIGRYPNSPTFVFNSRASFKINASIPRDLVEPPENFLNRVASVSSITARLVKADQCR